MRSKTASLHSQLSDSSAYGRLPQSCCPRPIPRDSAPSGLGQASGLSELPGDANVQPGLRLQHRYKQNLEQPCDFLIAQSDEVTLASPVSVGNFNNPFRQQSNLHSFETKAPALPSCLLAGPGPCNRTSGLPGFSAGPTAQVSMPLPLSGGSQTLSGLQDKGRERGQEKGPTELALLGTWCRC